MTGFMDESDSETHFAILIDDDRRYWCGNFESIGDEHSGFIAQTCLGWGNAARYCDEQYARDDAGKIIEHLAKMPTLSHWRSTCRVVRVRSSYRVTETWMDDESQSAELE